MSDGTNPKTIKVRSEEHDGAEIIINESDFNPDIHTKTDAPKPRTRTSAPAPANIAAAQGRVIPNPPAAGGVSEAQKTAGIKAEQAAGADKARGAAQS